MELWGFSLRIKGYRVSRTYALYVCSMHISLWSVRKIIEQIYIRCRLVLFIAHTLHIQSLGQENSLLTYNICSWAIYFFG